MKKISIILICVMLCTLLPISAAGVAPEIVAPADSIEVSENVFSVNCDSDEVVYEIDGLLLSQEGKSITVPSEFLTVGEHYLTVYAFSENGEVTQSSKKFTVYKNAENVKYDVNFDDFDGETFTSGMSAAIHKGLAGESELSIEEGKKGSGDTALGFTAKGKFSSGAPYLQFTFPKPYPAGKVIAEYDIKFNTNTDCLWHEFKNANNEDYFFLEWGKCFYSNGKIYGTDKTYPQGEFIRVKIVQDFKSGTSDMYINGESVIENRALAGKANSMQLMRICLASPTSDGGAGYVIDNIKIYEAEKYTGIKNAVQNEKNIDVYLNEALSEKSVSSNTVKLKKGDKEIEAEVSYDKDAKKITLTPTSLSDGEYTVIISGDAELESGIRVLTESRKSVKIGNDVQSQIKPQFYVNEVKLLKASQIKAGAKLSARIKTVSDGEKSVLMIITARDGEKIKDMKALTQNVPEGIGEAGAELVIPDGANKFTAVLLESWETGMAISDFSVFTLK